MSSHRLLFKLQAATPHVGVAAFLWGRGAKDRLFAVDFPPHNSQDVGHI